MKLNFLFTAIILFATAACGQSTVPLQELPIALASFTENYVDVVIRLEGNATDGYILSATFIPPDGYHLYSKDIPLTGVNGLGRPTLLELTEYSHIHAVDVLTESITAMKPDFEPKELLVYPSGAITLSLPIELPTGDMWLDDTIKVTYMACSASTCKSPVIGKVVPIRIPGADVYN